MRVAHLADLHLGRVFHAISLVEDQAFALQRVLDLLKRESIDVVVIAGDLYDRALPGREAVRLLDWFLREVNESLGLPVIAIAGNHDSADHLAFGSWMFRRDRLHVRGRAGPDAAPIVLHDDHGPVSFHALPYVEPEAAREWMAPLEPQEDAAPVTHRETLAAQLRRAREAALAADPARSVVVAHGFVRGDAMPRESPRSERSLYLGGAGALPASAFARFSYAALGHLHRPQSLTPDGAVRYAGSLLKYSFDEADHTKGLSIATLDARGLASVEHREIAPRRDLAKITGTLDELLTRPDLEHLTECYVEAELTDRPPPLQAMERLRARFHHAATLRFAAHERASPELAPGARSRPPDPVALFARFFERETGRPPGADELAVIQGVLSELHGEGVA